MSENAKRGKLQSDPRANRYSATELSRGKTKEILGKVAYGRAVVTIIHGGEAVAKIVPIDAQVTLPGESPLTDPTARLTTKDT